MQSLRTGNFLALIRSLSGSLRNTNWQTGNGGWFSGWPTKGSYYERVWLLTKIPWYGVMQKPNVLGSQQPDELGVSLWCIYNTENHLCFFWRQRCRWLSLGSLAFVSQSTVHKMHHWLRAYIFFLLEMEKIKPTVIFHRIVEMTKWDNVLKAPCTGLGI